MKRNMLEWRDEMIRSTQKKALPILSFPSIQIMGISVIDLISDSKKQALGMKLIADRTDSAASVSMMDLSVEAECFGSNIRFCIYNGRRTKSRSAKSWCRKDRKLPGSNKRSNYINYRPPSVCRNNWSLFSCRTAYGCQSGNIELLRRSGYG